MSGAYGCAIPLSEVDHLFVVHLLYSATVLFVLAHIMQVGLPQRGDYAVMMAFGPGLTMESILLKW